MAERVLLPGDPGRALRLAQQLLDGPKMLNHHRGLWGYSGPAADGRPLTIQSTGLGGPSAAAVVAELIALGARRLVRVGHGRRSRAAAPRPARSSSPRRVLPGDGASRALGARALAADATLVERAARRGGAGRARRPRRLDRPAARARPRRAGAGAGVEAVDLTSAAVLAAAARRGAAAACVLGISGVLGTAAGWSPTRSRSSSAELGRVAAAALVTRRQ